MKMPNGAGLTLSLVLGTCLLGLLLAACGRNTGGAGGGGAALKAGAAPGDGPKAAGGALTKPTPNEGADHAGKADATRKAADNQVVIENFAFSPATLTVEAGAEVTWFNRDDVPHTATENDKRFNSGTMDTDGKFSFTFKTPGTYNYFCALHPKMTGQIVVK